MCYNYLKVEQYINKINDGDSVKDESFTLSQRKARLLL